MDDRELTRALEALGLDRAHWRAVALLPLVEVAWADGRIQRAERELLAEIAEEHGLQPGETFLRRWLSRRPPKSTFVAARTLLLRLWSRAGERQAPQPQTLDQLLDLCTEVAEAAGGLLGLAFTVERSEREVIREIASSLALGPALPEPVRKAWTEEPTTIRPRRAKSAPAAGVHDAPTTRLTPPRGRKGGAATRPLESAHILAARTGQASQDTTRIRVRAAPAPAAPLDDEHEATRPYLDDVPDAPELADLDE